MDALGGDVNELWRIQDISTSSLERSDRRQTSREGQWPGRAQAALVQAQVWAGGGRQAHVRGCLCWEFWFRFWFWFWFCLRVSTSGQGIRRV
jgi:hypothetical protein